MATRRNSSNTDNSSNTEQTQTEEVTENTEVSEPAENSEVVEEVSTNRVPELLSSSPIFNNFCEQYLNASDEIAKYNKAVLAEKDAEWTPSKVVLKAREITSPEDASVPVNEEIKKAIDILDELIAQQAAARQNVIKLAAAELGITLATTVERNSETEAPLKEKRKLAHAIGKQLSDLGDMSGMPEFKSAINEFLAKNPLPQVGRDQVSNFNESSTGGTPRYRVTVTVKDSDGKVLVSEDGFTKTALKLPKYYDRGESPKADKLRAAWESAGNAPGKTVQSEVEFTDNGMTYTISAK